ncbi:MAG: isochorismatase family protein [Planctomycetaceae bacterium]|nr:isochorismatase family protein [Planctomycetaceae bacterium]
MLSASRCHLLVIDLQERLLPVIHEGDAVCSSSRFLMDAMQLLDVPTILSEQYPRGLGMTVELIREHPAISGQFEKLRFSAAEGFCENTGTSGAGLEDGSWTGTERDQVLICGIETHVCVLQTALELAGRGFEIFLAADAVGSRHPRDHDVALQRMRDSGITLTTAESAVFEMCGAAGTDTFRQLSQLVKSRAAQR